MSDRIEHGDNLESAKLLAQQQVEDTIQAPHWLVIACSLAADGQMTVRETTVRMDSKSIERAILQLTELLMQNRESSAPILPLPAADLDMQDLTPESAPVAG